MIGCDAAGLNIEDVYNRALPQEQLELADALSDALAHIPFDKQDRIPQSLPPAVRRNSRRQPVRVSPRHGAGGLRGLWPVNTWLRETRDPGGPAFFFNEDFSDYPIEPRNDRVYTIEQLLELSAAIGERRRQPAPEILKASGGVARAAVVAHIVSSFIALHESEVEHEREARRAAAIEERRRARLTDRTAAGAPAPDRPIAGF